MCAKLPITLNCFHRVLFTAFHNCPSEGRVFHHRLPALRRCPQRGPDRVPDQPGALPTYPLPSRHLRSRHLRREGLPRAAVGVRDHQRLLRALQPGTLSKQCSAEVGLASDRKARRNTDAGSIPHVRQGIFLPGVKKALRCSNGPCVQSHASASERTLKIKNQALAALPPFGWTRRNTAHTGRSG